MNTNTNVYQAIDQLYERFKLLCESKIDNARHDEFQAAVIVMSVWSKFGMNPYQRELYDRFKMYYKVNSLTILNDIKSLIPICREKHLERKKQNLTAKSKTKIHFDRNRSGIFRFLPGIKKTNYVENDYRIDDSFFEFEEQKIIRYLIKQIVYEKIDNYLTTKYPRLKDYDYVHQIFTELEKERPVEFELPNPIWGISKAAAMDLVYQLTHKDMKAKEGTKVLDFPSEKDKYMFIRLMIPEFRNTADSTLKSYFSSNRNVPQKNKLDIKIIK